MSYDWDSDETSRVFKVPVKSRLQSHVETLMRLTQDNHFFQKITAEHNSVDIHKECCQVMTLEEYGQGDIILNFGEDGDKFYIILSGQVSVMIPVKKKVKLTQKQLEKMKSMKDDSSNSSDSSDESEKSEEVFQKTYKKNTPGRRLGIAMNGVVSASEIIQKLRNEDKILSKIQEGVNPLIEKEETTIVKLFKEKLLKEKNDLLKIIKEAEEEFIEIEIDKLEEVHKLGKGDSFGELALMSDRPRAATIVAISDTRLLVLRKSQFKQILGVISERKQNAKIKALKSSPYFLSWSKNSLSKISFYFHSHSFSHKQELFAEGQKTTGIYFIREGEFTLSKKIAIKNSPTFDYFAKDSGKNTQKKIKLPRLVTDIKVVIKGKNESVGGYEIMGNYLTRQYSCICMSNKADVFFIQKEHFLSRIPNLEYIKEQIEEESQRLTERYTALCEAEQLKTNTFSRNNPSLYENEGIIPMSRYQSRNLQLAKKISYSPISSKFQSQSKTPIEVPKSKEYFRKLTDNEIFEAVNGRSLSHKVHEKKLITFIHKRFPPANFMTKIREKF